jgi:hypothetical protein
LYYLAFLRSVYIAYRFPTDDCPGYYGFAFSSGSNRTQSQTSQAPKAIPTGNTQYLSFAAATSAPVANFMLAQEAPTSKNMYGVYGRQGANPMPLMV